MLQILLLSAVWGVSFLMIRIAGTAFPPLWVALLRCALGAALLWTVLCLGGNKLPPRRLLPWLILVALFNNAMPFAFFAWGERTVPSNIAAVINATTPIWTLLLSLAIHRTRAALLTIGGVFLGFGGVLVVVVSHAGDPAADHAAGGLLRGIIVISLAALGYAVPPSWLRRSYKDLIPLALRPPSLRSLDS
jgi:drug/metabolite transporter (DMT)-like permease